MTTVLSPWDIAKGSLKYFTKKILGLIWHAHYDEWEKALQNDRCLFEAPRGSRKSYFFALARPLWKIINGKYEFLFVSDTEDQARKLLRTLREKVETTPFLEPLRPSSKEIWGTDQVSFKNGSFVSIMGFGTSRRGIHPDEILCDDIESETSKMSREDKNRAFFGVISGMAMPHTKIIVDGTPVDFEDLLQQLSGNPIYHTWRRPAIVDGVIQYPDLFTKEWLDTRRLEMGSINFAREYLLERIDPATAPFKMEFACYYEESPANMARTVLVCDPAYSEGDGDATAIVVVSFTHGNRAYVLQAKEIRKENIGDIINELARSIDTYKPSVVGIEKRKGEAISYSFEEWRNRNNRWDFAYVPISHGGLSKGQRANMVGGLIPRWEARTVYLHKSQQALLEQLQRFRFDELTKGHDDLVDALAYCFHPDLVSPNPGKRYIYKVMQNHEKKQPFYGVGKTCQGATMIQKILGGKL